MPLLLSILTPVILPYSSAYFILLIYLIVLFYPILAAPVFGKMLMHEFLIPYNCTDVVALAQALLSKTKVFVL